MNTESKTQEKANASLWENYVSVDSLGDEVKDESPLFSDGGYGAWSIYAAQENGRTRKQCIEAARKFVKRNAPKCLETFCLIIKHGKNRRESIWAIAKAMAEKRKKRRSKTRKRGKRQRKNTGVI